MDTPTPRDEQGRFTPGCPGGPGRPKGRTNALQQAIEEAITPEHLKAVVRRVLRQALEGNLSAAKFITERAVGKSREAQGPLEPLDLVLPNLKTVEGCTTAIDKLSAAITAGTVDLAAAKVLLDVIQAKLKALELHDFGKRLAELEESAKLVERR